MRLSSSALSIAIRLGSKEGGVAGDWGFGAGAEV